VKLPDERLEKIVCGSKVNPHTSVLYADEVHMRPFSGKDLNALFRRFQRCIERVQQDILKYGRPLSEGSFWQSQ
jgi:hypothetical protein